MKSFGVLRVVVVTGGATHLGRATAELFAGDGNAVVIASRDGERCEDVARQISQRHGPCLGVHCDVTDPESVRNLFETVEATYGHVDVVVCNAGGSLTRESFLDADIGDVDDTIRVNLLGSYVCAHEAASRMRSRGSGAIIFVSSIHGVVGSDPALYDGISNFVPSGPAYHAAKGGVIQLTRSLAATLGSDGIRVNCVSPGIVPTARTPVDLLDRFADRTPLRRLGAPEDVAYAIEFLASDRASWITGQNLVVDGGWTIL